MNRATAKQVAAQFGWDIERVKAQYAKNAEQLRQLELAAGNGAYRGKTAAQWSHLAQHAEDQSR